MRESAERENKGSQVCVDVRTERRPNLSDRKRRKQLSISVQSQGGGSDTLTCARVIVTSWHATLGMCTWVWIYAASNVRCLNTPK